MSTYGLNKYQKIRYSEYRKQGVTRKKSRNLVVQHGVASTQVDKPSTMWVGQPKKRIRSALDTFKYVTKLDNLESKIR